MLWQMNCHSCVVTAVPTLQECGWIGQGTGLVSSGSLSNLTCWCLPTTEISNKIRMRCHHDLGCGPSPTGSVSRLIWHVTHYFHFLYTSLPSTVIQSLNSSNCSKLCSNHCSDIETPRMVIYFTIFTYVACAAYRTVVSVSRRNDKILDLSYG